MYFHRALLSKHLDVTDIDHTIADQLIHKTCEVEHIQMRNIPDRVVIGYVSECTKHPNADTLSVCQVDCGSHGVFQILTWWENITSDMYVPVALPDCYLPAVDLHIVGRKMRWLDSNGMICSKSELGIREDEDQHWIWILHRTTADGIDQEILDIQWRGDMPDLTHSDKGISLAIKYPWLNNWILEVDNKTLTHRPDLTGHYGLAQEINTIIKTKQ